MIKYMRYKENCFKFHNGINFIDDFNVVEYAGTIFGSFTNAFKHGNGRRIDIPKDEVEIAMSCCASFNKKTFNFTRVYTDSRTDTEEIDKRQDIYRYGTKCEKKMSDKDNKEEIILPVFCYYNNESKFNNLIVSLTNVDVMSDRGYGYNSCLINYNHFDATQQYFAISSYVAWQHDINNTNENFVNKYKKAIKDINDIIGKIGYGGIRYDLLKQSIVVKNGDEDIELKNIEDKDEQIFVSIVFDIFMRTLMLNHHQSIDIEDTEGVIVISYKFNDNMLNHLVNSLTGKLPNVQIIAHKNKV